jgi:hypothetical protein
VIGILFVLSNTANDGNCADQPVPLQMEMARPGVESGPTQVSVGIWLADISKIDSVSQTFSANLFFVLNWRDPSLAHNEPGIKRYNLKDIWHPDWIVENAATKLFPTLPEIAEVAADGTVSYQQRFLGSFAQLFDFYAFPFDHSTFRINFIAANSRAPEIQFVPHNSMITKGMQHGAGIARNLTLRDWQITGFTTRAQPYHIAPGIEYAGYTFEFKAARLTQHYIIKIIIPLLLIVMMSWAAFWIDPSLGGSQISVATTSMLTLISYRFSIGAEVPKLPYLTHLDAFILTSTILVFLTLAEVVLTTTLACNDKLHLARKVDRYARFVFPTGYIVVLVMTLFR